MRARDYCLTLVTKYAAGVGVGSMVPIPGTSVVVTAAEVKLVIDIARAYGESLGDADAMKVIALSGAKNIGVKAVGEIASFIPVIGWLARPALFGASVKAVGDAVIKHFEARRPGAEYLGP